MEDIVQNKRNLYIIGADGLAREIESLYARSVQAQKKWDLKGFLYDIKDKNPMDGYPSNYRIVGGWSDFEYSANDAVLIGVADPKWRRKIYETLEGRVRIESFVYDDVYLGEFTEIPAGTIITNNASISTNVKLGKACFFNSATQIGHDVEIGDFCSFMAHVDVGGFTKFGDEVFIGSKATILPKRKIASNVTIGAGSVVLRNVKQSGVTLFGNPAETI